MKSWCVERPDGAVTVTALLMRICDGVLSFYAESMWAGEAPITVAYAPGQWLSVVAVPASEDKP